MKTENKIYLIMGLALVILTLYTINPKPFTTSLEELDEYCDISCKSEGYGYGLTEDYYRIESGDVACEIWTWCNNMIGSPRCCCCHVETGPTPVQQCYNECINRNYDTGYLTSTSCTEGEADLGVYGSSRCCCSKVSSGPIVPFADIIVPLALVTVLLMIIGLYYSRWR